MPEATPNTKCRSLTEEDYSSTVVFQSTLLKLHEILKNKKEKTVLDKYEAYLNPKDHCWDIFKNRRATQLLQLKESAFFFLLFLTSVVSHHHIQHATEGCFVARKIQSLTDVALNVTNILEDWELTAFSGWKM